MNRNQETTEESNYKKKLLSEINNTKELFEGFFPINLKTIDQYQHKHPSLLDKYEIVMYQKGSFRGLSNIQLKIITFSYKVVIPIIIQKCVLRWYHTYLLHPVMDRTETMICQICTGPALEKPTRRK